MTIVKPLKRVILWDVTLRATTSNYSSIFVTDFVKAIVFCIIMLITCGDHFEVDCLQMLLNCRGTLVDYFLQVLQKFTLWLIRYLDNSHLSTHAQKLSRKHNFRTALSLVWYIFLSFKPRNLFYIFLKSNETSEF